MADDMREIKFRAWDKDDKEMSYFDFYSITNEYDNGRTFLGDHYFCDNDEKECIMQFTGLKDKNGKEIYEGDIVESDEGHIWNVFMAEDGSWVLDENDNSYKAFTVYNQQDMIKVIGNIYENKKGNSKV